MFGFLKKKKDNDKEAEKAEPKEKKENQPDEPPKKPVKKKKSILKLLLIVFVVLIVAGISGFVVYKLWFSKPSNSASAPRIYQKIPLPQTQLPEEMLEFSFYHFPAFYDALVEYNRELTLIDNEIKRIQDIAKTYPDQKKIADKEIQVWDKTRQKLKNTFIKLEKPVKQTYVLFRVNKEKGLVRVKEIKSDLENTAREALVQTRKITEKLIKPDTVPDGLIKGTIYKLKKKFL